MQKPGIVTPLEHALERWETQCRLLSRESSADTLKRARERISELEAELARRPAYCPTCDGTGKTWTHEDSISHRCSQCRGSGILHPTTAGSVR